MDSFAMGCPLRSRRIKRDVPWWNETLEKLRKQARNQANKAKSSDDPEEKARLKAAHKAALTEYNKEIRKSKRKSWKGFCEEIKDLPTASRIRKVLSKEHTCGIGSLKKSDGTFTTDGQETVGVLLNTHFPDCQVVGDVDVEAANPVNTSINYRSQAWQRSSRIFSEQRLRWAIGSFKPFKSAGLDGVFEKALMS